MLHSKQQHCDGNKPFLTSRSARSSLRTGGEFSPTPADMTMASTLPFRCTMYAPMYFLIRCTYTCRRWMLSPLHYSKAPKRSKQSAVGTCFVLVQKRRFCCGALKARQVVAWHINAEWPQKQHFKSKAQHMGTEWSAKRVPTVDPTQLCCQPVVHFCMRQGSKERASQAGTVILGIDG